MSKFKTYAKSILIPLVVGGIVGFITSSSMDYETLKQPFLSPPSIVFPIVWTILYTLMGISYGILQTNQLTNPQINTIYYLQLAVNAIWPIIFFTLKMRLTAFLIILLLIALIITMIIKFYPKNKTASLLQIPYLIWTLFASYLNIAVYLLNR